VGADQDVVAVEVAARGDLPLRLEHPQLLSVRGREAVEPAVQVTDEDLAVLHRRRRLQVPELGLPLLLAGGDVEGVEVLVERADVDDPAGDRGGAFDRVAGLELPAFGELVGELRRADARHERVAAEQRPVGGGSGGEEEHGGHGEEAATHRRLPEEESHAEAQGRREKSRRIPPRPPGLSPRLCASA
jgi:hypothetical protein